MSKKVVVVGVDGSNPSNMALDRVIAEAGARELEIVLVAVAEAMSAFTTRPDYIEFLEHLKAEAKGILEDAMQRVEAAGFKARGMLETGRPAVKVAEIAKAENADEIVVGSLGKDAVAKLLVGSVSSRLLETAPCTVVVVR